MQLTQKKRQRTDLLTVAAVAALFVVMAALLYTGHLTRQGRDHGARHAAHAAQHHDDQDLDGHIVIKGSRLDVGQ